MKKTNLIYLLLVILSTSSTLLDVEADPIHSFDHFDTQEFLEPIIDNLKASSPLAIKTIAYNR